MANLELLAERISKAMIEIAGRSLTKKAHLAKQAVAPSTPIPASQYRIMQPDALIVFIDPPISKIDWESSTPHNFNSDTEDTVATSVFYENSLDSSSESSGADN